MKEISFICKFLTTTSALALIAGGTSSALDATNVIKTTGACNQANLNTGVNIQDTTSAGEAFANGDSIILQV